MILDDAGESHARRREWRDRRQERYFPNSRTGTEAGRRALAGNSWRLVTSVISTAAASCFSATGRVRSYFRRGEHLSAESIGALGIRRSSCAAFRIPDEVRRPSSYGRRPPTPICRRRVSSFLKEGWLLTRCQLIQFHASLPYGLGKIFKRCCAGLSGSRRVSI